MVKVSPTGNAAQIELVGGRTGTTEVTVLYAGQVYSCQVTVLAADTQSSGDVNGDGYVDSRDALLLMQLLMQRGLLS